VISRRFAAWAIAALLGVAPVPAQEKPIARGAGDRNEIVKMIDAYILSNLQESLGLTDVQFVKVLPLVKRLQTDKRDLAQRRFEITREMRQMLESGTATETHIVDLMRELKALEGDEPATLRKDQDAVDATLTPLQQAKYRILGIQVDQKIRGLMARRPQGADGAHR
jgi:hypothetical protein